jgi:DmsE family decaheme c-type cytochrome
MKRGSAFIGLLLFAFLSFAVLLALSSLRAKEAASREDYVGSETCKECHEEQYKNYKMSIHYLTEKMDLKAKGCEACHGQGSAHMEAGGGAGTIFSFKASVPAAEKTEKCLACHSQENKNFIFPSGDHMKGSVTCSDCHQPHSEMGKDMLLTKQGYKLCLNCHREIAEKLVLNERHRISEGMVQCTDCHQTHEQSPRTRLGGFKQEACFKCHTDKQGPFIYEHGAIRVEGCTACHDPHGSVNRHMLTHQSTADLCFSCHASLPIWHNRFTPDSVCTNCHSTIHGSQLSPKFIK